LAIQDIRATEQNKVMHRLNKRYFDLVIYLVYNKALLLIIQQYTILHQKEEEAKASQKGQEEEAKIVRPEV
jgi:hypothetical protein